MTNQQYVQKIKETFDACLAIVQAKNADYSGEDDAFKAFQLSKLVGVSPHQAILVRILDKISRVRNLLQVEGQVPEEKITDTLMDAANYCVILKVMLEDESKPTP